VLLAAGVECDRSEAVRSRDLLTVCEAAGITQERKSHGAGPHHCLGHFLARTDMTEALRLLAQRIKNPAYDGAPCWLPDSGNTGPVSLPINFEVAT
jgi:hypothetical protein